MRRTSKGVVAGTLMWLMAAAPAAAATTGTTTVGAAVAGQHADVTASVTSATPVAPYEFSIENRCWFSGRFSGHFDSYERFDIAGPWFDVGGVPTITVQVNLNDVPAGSACRVSSVRENTVVKGSTSSYIGSA